MLLRSRPAVLRQMQSDFPLDVFRGSPATRNTPCAADSNRFFHWCHFPNTRQRRFYHCFCTPEPSGPTRLTADSVILPRFSMNSNLSLELLSDLKSSYVLFSPLKSAKISLESIFSLLYCIWKASVPLTLTVFGHEKSTHCWVLWLRVFCKRYSALSKSSGSIGSSISSKGWPYAFSMTAFASSIVVGNIFIATNLPCLPFVVCLATYIEIYLSAHRHLAP